MDDGDDEEEEGHEYYECKYHGKLLGLCLISIRLFKVAEVVCVSLEY